MSSPLSIPPRLDRRQRVMIVAAALGRLTLGAAVIIAMMLVVPEQPEPSLAVPIIIATASTGLYGWFFLRQIRSVRTARYPMLRAGEALVLVAAMFLAIFAMIYVMVSATTAGAFTEPLDPFTAYYFALTVLATVGFGDITPVTTLARSVTMVQMAVDIAFIAVLIRVIGTVARRTIEERRARASAGAAGGGAASGDR